MAGGTETAISRLAWRSKGQTDAIIRHLARQTRQLALFAVANDAQHFHRLSDKGRLLAEDGVFSGQGQQATVDAFSFAVAAWPAACQP